MTFCVCQENVHDGQIQNQYCNQDNRPIVVVLSQSGLYKFNARQQHSPRLQNVASLNGEIFVPKVKNETHCQSSHYHANCLSLRQFSTWRNELDTVLLESIWLTGDMELRIFLNYSKKSSCYVIQRKHSDQFIPVETVSDMIVWVDSTAHLNPNISLNGFSYVHVYLHKNDFIHFSLKNCGFGKFLGKK